MAVGRLLDLSDRVAIVTGAGSGLGRAVAVTLGAAGATVVCADIAAYAAADTATVITGDGGSAEPATVDVTDRAGVFEMCERTVLAHGRLDVMCNIAGVPGARVPVAELTEADFDRVLAVHLKGVLFGCQAAVRAMAPRRAGSIVNMSSTAIDTPRAGLASYTVAKAGVAELTKVLAVEAGPLGIRVNAIAPGFVETPLSLAGVTSPTGEIDEGRRAATVEAMAAMPPLGRIGRPEDVAHQVLYLASDAAAFVTGQTLRPNGGASMPR